MKRTVCALLLGCVSAAVAWGQQPYVPVSLPKAELRSRGDDAMGAVLTELEAAFHARYPQVTFARVLQGSGTGMAGIITSLSDLSLMGRPATSNEQMGFEWVFRYKPQGVQVMNGGLNRNRTPGKAFGQDERSSALLVLVPRANPLRSLTPEQMKRLLACEEACAGATTWAAAGLTGAWASRPVHAYVYDEETGTGAFLQQAVEGRGDRWNWDVVREFRDSAEGSAAARIVAAAAKDPDALAVSTVSLPGLKTVALGPEGKAVQATRETLIDGSYPLGRGVYLYVNQPPGKPVPPATREFLRFVLSAEGQAIVAKQGDYLPLSAEAAARELGKLR